MHTIKITYGKERIQSDILIVDYFTDQGIKYGDRFAEDDAFYELVKPTFENGDFEGKWKQTFMMYTYNKIPERRIMLVGLGEKKDVYPFKIKVSFAHGLKVIRSFRGVRTVSAFIDKHYNPEKLKEIATFLVEAAYMSQYTKPSYKKNPETPFLPIEHLHLIIPEEIDEEQIKEGIHQGEIIGQGINEMRDLVNKPGNEVTPTYLAKYAHDLCKQHAQLSCETFEKEQLEEMGMGGLLNVAKGSAEPPVMISCTYTPQVTPKCTVAFVGKGVTFDSGGISIKPSSNLYLMKIDMAGAALVLIMMKVIALLKLPIKVYGIVPACENMPSGTALKPGDIIKAFDGTTVEIIDTDAEGRLILMDGLGYAVTKNPNVVIDVATLTGACTVALGRYVMGGMSNYEPVMNIMRASGDYMYERVWQLPLMEEYRLMMESKFADIKNYGGREAGAITAGAFLSHFVGKTPWIHLDIAAVSWFDSETSLMPHGATGVGVRLLTNFLYRLLNEEQDIWNKQIADVEQTLYQENEVPETRDLSR